MKKSYKIRITSSKSVKTIIRIIYTIIVDNNPQQFIETRELMFSKDIPIKKNEEILIQEFPLKINEVYTELRSGHIYKIGIVYYKKQVKGIQPLNAEIKSFNEIINNIVKGLKSNEKKI